MVKPRNSGKMLYIKIIISVMKCQMIIGHMNLIFQMMPSKKLQSIILVYQLHFILLKKGIMFELQLNQVRGSFSLPLPTTPCTEASDRRLRTGRFSKMFKMNGFNTTHSFQCWLLMVSPNSPKPVRA